MIASFALDCADRGTDQGQWEFRSFQNGMNVFDPRGQLVCWFPHEQARKRLALPSFWRSVKPIVLTTDRGTVVNFRPDPGAVRLVRQYLDDALLAGGIEAVRDLRLRAALALAVGLGLVVVCLGIAYLFDAVLHLGADSGRRYTKPFIAGAIGGMVLAVWGTRTLLRCVRLFRRWKEDR